MLKKCENIITQTYEYGDWRVDVVDHDDQYEAYLYHPDFGVKDMMFGVPKSQELPEGKMNLELFLKLVEANLENQGYIFHYIEDYAPELMHEYKLVRKK